MPSYPPNTHTYTTDNLLYQQDTMVILNSTLSPASLISRSSFFHSFCIPVKKEIPWQEMDKFWIHEVISNSFAHFKHWTAWVCAMSLTCRYCIAQRMTSLPGRLPSAGIYQFFPNVALCSECPWFLPALPDKKLHGARTFMPSKVPLHLHQMEVSAHS